MFSDGFRKNHFKGTSYEVEIKEDMTEENVIDALTIFFEDFMIIEYFFILLSWILK